MAASAAFRVRAIALYRQGHVLGSYEIPADVRSRRASLESVAADMLRRGEGWDFQRLTLSLDGWRAYTRVAESETWDEDLLAHLAPGGAER